MIGNLSLLELFQGSPTMVVLLVCSIITVAFALERSLYFARHAGDCAGFMQQIGKKLRGGDQRGALQLCSSGKTAVQRVMSQGLSNLNLPREHLAQRMATAVELEQVEMERFLNILGTMSNIAPLLGLFGTVIGIIRAFAAIARTGSGGSAVVAMGVAEALMTTAAGIIVAVIATVFYNIFVRMIRSRIAKLEDAREEFFVQLAGANLQSSRSASSSYAQSGQQQAPRPVAEPQLAPADLLS